MMKMKKKTKMGIFKVYYFASGTYSLAFKVYLKYVNCIFSYTLPCFVDFRPISGFCSYTDVWGKRKKPRHPYIGSTVLIHIHIGFFNLQVH